MTKIIKLTQSDLKKVINKALNEQNTAPLPSAVSRPQQQSVQTPPAQAMQEQPIHTNDEGRPTLGPPSDILMAKKGVDQNLREALVSMKRLMILSGVNPQTNNIVQDIEKVIQKFDDLYGNPKPPEVKEKK
jgi:hypothetical protein